MTKHDISGALASAIRAYENVIESIAVDVANARDFVCMGAGRADRDGGERIGMRTGKIHVDLLLRSASEHDVNAACEIIHARADAEKPNMGLTSWRGAKVRKQDVGIAKNYLTEDELRALNNLAEQYLIFAEGQAMRRIPMYMSDWIKKLDAFLNINDRDILTHAGKISHDMALQRAEREYEQFHVRRIEEQTRAASDFDRLTKQLTDGKRDKKP